MSFESFHALGERVEKRWERLDFAEAAFTDLALEFLESEAADLEFDFEALPRFLLSGKVPQQPRTRFSNLPITVFRCDHFYLECLIWTSASTSIHQHAFDGAFRVLQGGSLHSAFRFSPEAKRDPHLALGKVVPAGIEVLSAGDARPIRSGSEAAAHALYHLEQPSVTLVLRTFGSSAKEPQWALYRPGLALGGLEEDEQVVMGLRMLRTLERIGGRDLAEVWREMMRGLSLPRAVTMCLQGEDLLSEETSEEVVLATLEERDRSVGERVRDVLIEERRLIGLSQCRDTVSDPELRFFVALLMHASSREELLGLLDEREAEARKAGAVIFAERLLALAEPSAVLGSVHAFLRRGTRAGIPNRFVHELVAICQSVPERLRSPLLEAFARGDTVPASLEALKQSGAGAPDLEPCRAALLKLRAVPELGGPASGQVRSPRDSG